MIRRLCVGILVLGLVACGGEPESAPSTQPTPNAGVPAASIGGPNNPPVIESVRLVPEEPRPGEPARVLVETSDEDGDRVSLT